uniref:Uncharacterized protein n=1 Tax=Oryza nivara TaxID=4536 RepID=A0A0E0G2D2_ORYNI
MLCCLAALGQQNDDLAKPNRRFPPNQASSSDTPIRCLLNDDLTIFHRAIASNEGTRERWGSMAA